MSGRLAQLFTIAKNKQPHCNIYALVLLKKVNIPPFKPFLSP